MGSVQLGGLRAMVGHTHGVMAVEHTSIPARRKAPMSRMLSSAWAAVGPKWTRASGRSATSASRSSVAVTPTGPIPHSSPTSAPTLSGLLTPTPTSSKAGWRMTSGMTILPTNPVPQTTTRLAPPLIGASRPELTSRYWPVTALAWSEAKKAATSATSPSSVIRRSGNLPTMSSSTSSSVRPWLAAVPFTYISTFGPHIHDGMTMLQRMLSGPSSSHR